ncbi:MAG: TPM domain-containing protein [Candidatus Eremiobacteraeota bacterium]|nr:TPM domain-containing protein [Candidatus Eremiobacteraeota bacterium]
MCKQQLRVFFLVLALFVSALALPEKSGYLNDYAHVLGSDQTRSQLQANLQSWNASGKSRLFVVTIENLEKYKLKDINSTTQTWFQHWGLGQKDVLLLVSAGERQAGVELGSGWTKGEQARADRILEDTVKPLCASGDASAAVVQGSYALHTLAPEASQPAPQPTRQPAAARPTPKKGLAYYLSFSAFSWPVTLGLFLLGTGVAGVGLLGSRPGMVALGALIFLGTALSGLVLMAMKLTFLFGLAILGFMFLLFFMKIAASGRNDDCHRHHHCHDDDSSGHLLGALLSWMFSSRRR